MSSWVRGAKTYAKRTMTVPFYYDITKSKDIASTFLELLGAFIYSRKQNENCTIYDPNGLINDTLRYNPGIKMIEFLTVRLYKCSHDPRQEVAIVLAAIAHQEQPNLHAPQLHALAHT